MIFFVNDFRGVVQPMVRTTIIGYMMATAMLFGGLFSSKKVVIKRMHQPMDVAYEKGEAFARVNEIREALGMNTLESNDALAKAAQAHADYLVQNRAHEHNEIRGLPGFTGLHPVDRAIHAGYASRMVLENLSTQNYDAESSVSGLFSAIYHRFTFLDEGIDEIGVGVAQDKTNTKNSAFVYDMGNSEINRLCRMKAFSGSGKFVYGVCGDKKHPLPYSRFLKAQNAMKWLNPKIVVYPYDGQKEVPPAFYAEIPDPLPDFDVSGFPVSISFNDYFFKHITLRSFRLFEVGGKEVAYKRVLSKESDPNRRFSGLQFALFPLNRLKYDTSYRAEVIYVHHGREITKTWTFHTHKPQEKLLRITALDTKVDLQRGKGYQLYFVPRNGHDVLKDVMFPDDVDVSFSDNNTLRVRVYAKKSGDFSIRSGQRTLKVHVVDSAQK